MAKFINKKEQVYDLRLTAYGRYLISIGKFTPEYYAFFDDNVLYDSNYAGFPEQQNHTEERILNETQYLESLVLFEDVDSMLDTEEMIDLNNLDLTPTKMTPRKDVFRFTEPIGDAYLDGESQSAPAWKVVALNGFITSSHHEDSVTNAKIPQINVDLNYRKVVIDFEVDPDDETNTIENPKDIFDVVNSTSTFVDNKVIKLRTDNAMFYVDEVNTEILNENFEIEVFKKVFIPCKKAKAEITLVSAPFLDAQWTNNDSITLSDGTVTRTYIWKETPDSENDCELQLDADSDAEPTLENNIEALKNAIFGLEGKTGCMCEKLSLVSEPEITVKRGGLTAATTLKIENTECGTQGNTEIIYNFNDTEIYDFLYTAPGFTGGVSSTSDSERLEKKYFQKETPQVVDGFMVSNEPEVNSVQYYTTSSVEYYFNVLIDSQVPEDEACKASELFNKQSYYVDLDFDCEKLGQENVFFDIYGPATNPDICETS